MARRSAEIARRDAVVLRLADGYELRYHDAEDMGKIYLTADLAQVPTFAGLGPDADDPALTAEVSASGSRNTRARSRAC